MRSPDAVMRRPPRPLVLASSMKGGGAPLGHKPMSQAKSDASMEELVGLLANSQPAGPIDPQTAAILQKVLGKHLRG